VRGDRSSPAVPPEKTARDLPVARQPRGDL